MAERVFRHPSVDQRVRDATTSMLTSLRRSLRDLGRVEYLAHAHVTLDQGEESRSISDLQDLVDARVVEALVLELDAEREVERLLSDAERGPAVG